jgi:TonB family protein
VDTLATGSSATAGAPRRNPVAQEVPVDVTGARPGLEAGKRELFRESTTSVLVFENGGVIRLAVDVATGQLLFLIHTATKREVVAQVTRKHALGSGYVEVEFTEPAPGFWGADFPFDPEPRQTQLIESAPAAALREAVRRADQETSVGPATPSVAEVERLKSEVEALRQQLESIKRHAETPVPTPPWVANKVKAEALEAAELAAEAAEAGESAAVSEPAEAAPEFVAHNLLPKAALDFSRSDARNALAPKAQAAAQSGSSTGKLRLALLAALALAMLGATWYQGWIPRLAYRKPQPAVAATPTPLIALKPAAGRVQKPGAAVGALTVPLTNRSDAAETKTTGTAPVGDVLVEKAEKGSEKEAESEASPTEGLAAPAPSAVARSGKAALILEKTGRKELDTDGARAAALEDQEDVVPPKLVHSVRAVPPPEAVRQFATGNVIVDAVVDATGRVNSSTVLSGPPSLRNAAVNALKQYRYKPAKRRGKAVPAHVQVTVQFWYEP